jgi:cobalamin biosynthesis Mg chelatase CobN
MHNEIYFFMLKTRLMKRIIFAISTVAIMASCTQNNPRPAAETQTIKPADTAGLAQFQQWKTQNELAVANQMAQANQLTSQQAQPTKEVVRERVVYVNEPRRTTSRSRSTVSRSSSSSAGSSSGVYNSTSSNTAAQKKGWSKAAKGAAIGGAGGAVLGAVINKRNRAVGAVIGGVLGAGVGYGIGRSKDKKDGRY